LELLGETKSSESGLIKKFLKIGLGSLGFLSSLLGLLSLARLLFGEFLEVETRSGLLLVETNETIHTSEGTSTVGVSHTTETGSAICVRGS
jgi:hypothetical protein